MVSKITKKPTYTEPEGEYGNGVTVEKIGEIYKIHIPKRPRLGGGENIEEKNNKTATYEYAQGASTRIAGLKLRSRWE